MWEVFQIAIILLLFEFTYYLIPLRQESLGAIVQICIIKLNDGVL